MSDAASERIAVIRSPEARADLRAIEGGIAVQIFPSGLPAIMELTHTPRDWPPG
jgi:hypothetical protein